MTRIFAPLTVGALLASTAAMAQVTAADVWANSNALLEAMGGTVSATPTTEGATTTYRDYVATFVLPFAAGETTLGLPTTAMTENGDGSVTLGFPEGYDISFTGQITGQGSFDVELEGSVGDTEIVATGTPGDVVYTSTGSQFAFALTEATVDGVAVEDFDFALAAESTGSESVMRITTGDLVTLTMESTAESSVVEWSYDVAGIESGSSRTVSTIGGTDVELALPAQGTDIMNLASALRDGMVIRLANDVASAQTTNVTRDSLGVITSEQNTSQGATAFDMRLDASGLGLSGTSADFTIDAREQILPFPINVGIAEVALDWQFPLLASPEVQPLVFDTTLSGLTITDALWDLVDPDKTLDRSPATYRLDMNADAIVTTDLLDIAALSDLGQTGELPGTLPAVRIEDFVLEALGAVVTAQGAFDLDFDAMPFMGTPMPSGTLTFSADGVLAAADALAAVGLIGPQDGMSVRFALGTFGIESGADQYDGEIEVTEDGQFLVNGNPM